MTWRTGKSGAYFNQDKGYTFVQPEGGGPSLFLHAGIVERAGHTFDAALRHRHCRYLEMNSDRGPRVGAIELLD